jgi:hypothetical protein
LIETPGMTALLVELENLILAALRVFEFSHKLNLKRTSDEPRASASAIRERE